MSHRRTDLHTLTAAYALDALEPAEREAFTPHLAACEACRRETAEFRATAARMAAAVAEAPPNAMRQRTMAAVDAVRQLPPRVAAGAPAPALGGSLRRRACPRTARTCRCRLPPALTWGPPTRPRRLR
ncbi:zf-HC2 domain-containing protein, partial [Streptomyces sp. NPDC059538]|uniref:zf-HC2 domain-containing protein n=1 Tax=Streptomyces sp. NPDC059538 TaxID=3346860 RepID=UPI0036B8530D